METKVERAVRAAQAEEAGVLRDALAFLYEQVCSLDGYTVTRDLDRHKAEAVFDDAVEQARKALQPKQVAIHDYSRTTPPAVE